MVLCTTALDGHVYMAMTPYLPKKKKILESYSGTQHELEEEEF